MDDIPRDVIASRSRGVHQFVSQLMPPFGNSRIATVAQSSAEHSPDTVSYNNFPFTVYFSCSHLFDMNICFVYFIIAQG